MQQYVDIYLLQYHSKCFMCPLHPSSGVLKTVTAASGTGHNLLLAEDVADEDVQVDIRFLSLSNEQDISYLVLPATTLTTECPTLLRAVVPIPRVQLKQIG